jgi:hypothetical protein
MKTYVIELFTRYRYRETWRGKNVSMALKMYNKPYNRRSPRRLLVIEERIVARTPKGKFEDWSSEPVVI